MLRRALTPLAIGTLVFLAGCLSENLTRSTDGPMFAVSDGAHHGNPDFFFLPPMFGNPNHDPNFEPAAFNGTLRPAVEICELGAPAADLTRSCITGAPVKRFAPAAVNVSLTDQQYSVNWDTKAQALNVNKFYRIEVLVGTTVLGFADVDPVSNGSQLKNVQTNEYIGLVDGRTLPIKFRIEDGALCGSDGTACAAETINLTQGGGVDLVVPGEDFHFDVPAGTQATAGGQPVTDVTFNLEKCESIDVDLPKFGQCLRVTALYDAPGTVLTFTQPILISMCSFVPVSEGQQELITLHQQDGDLIRALPHASPNCNVIGAREPAPSGLLARSWHWMRDLATTMVTPRALHAATRTTMLHLGGGGETTKTGATCTPPPSPTAHNAAPHMALGTCTPSSAALTPLPTAGHTVSDFQFALPAKMDYVDPDDASRTAPPGALSTAVKVTDWNGGAVQGAKVTFTQIGDPNIVIGTGTSNSDGFAQVSWTIAAGPNTLVASGRGIAAANNFPPDVTVKPFMPDIFSETPQTPVTLGTGEITFLATGASADLVVTSFIKSPGSPTTADLITFTAVITNVGSGAAGPSTAGIRVGGEAAPGQTFEVPALAPGAADTIQRSIVLDVAQGYENHALADVNNAVVESNETNNDQPLTFVVTAPVLDQQNLLDGSLGGQGIGRFNDINGAADPTGTSFDYQDAQTFTAGTSGRLVLIKVPVINTNLSTTGVTLEVLAVTGGAPDNATSLGQVTIPASAISSNFADISNPAAWATFNVSGLGINVTSGQAYSFVVRTTSGVAYLYNPEFTIGYANGSGFRRNLALAAAWSNNEADFGFQTFVAP